MKRKYEWDRQTDRHKDRQKKTNRQRDLEVTSNLSQSISKQCDALIRALIGNKLLIVFS